MKNPIKKPNLDKLGFFVVQYIDLKKMSERFSHKAYYVNFRYLSDKTKKRGSWSSFLILIIYCCGSTVGAGNGGDIGCADGSPPAIRDNGNH